MNEAITTKVQTMSARLPEDGTTPAAGNPAPASPTGAPWIPAKWVPALVALCTASEVAAYYLTDGSVADMIAHGIAALCVAIGIASPGLRKK